MAQYDRNQKTISHMIKLIILTTKTNLPKKNATAKNY